MSALFRLRMLVGAGTLGIVAACVLLFVAPRFVSTSIATAEVTPGKTLAKTPDIVRVNVDQLHQLNLVTIRVTNPGLPVMIQAQLRLAVDHNAGRA